MDPAQAKMMRYMPLMFLVFLYSYSSGLALYWTVNNVLTIVQTKLTKMNQAPVSPAAEFSIDAGVKKEKIRPATVFDYSTISCPHNRKKLWRKFLRPSAFRRRSRNTNWRKVFCST